MRGSRQDADHTSEAFHEQQSCYATTKHWALHAFQVDVFVEQDDISVDVRPGSDRLQCTIQAPERNAYKTILFGLGLANSAGSTHVGIEVVLHHQGLDKTRKIIVVDSNDDQTVRRWGRDSHFARKQTRFINHPARV